MGSVRLITTPVLATMESFRFRKFAGKRACYRDRMATVRKVLTPLREGDNVTLAQARAVFREIRIERERAAEEKKAARKKAAAKRK